MAIKGFDRVKANMMKVQRKIKSTAGKIFRREMELVITKAKTLCPVDLGTLRSSGRADGPKGGLKTTKIEVEGSFGSGPSGKYALYAHEGVGTKSRGSGGMTINYKVGQPKFLEQPFKEMEAGFFRKVAEETAL